MLLLLQNVNFFFVFMLCCFLICVHKCVICVNSLGFGRVFMIGRWIFFKCSKLWLVAVLKLVAGGFSSIVPGTGVARGMPAGFRNFLKANGI